MPKARVELRGSMSHTGNGRKFEKGKPQIMTNPSDIAYYQQQGEFSVTMLEEDDEKPAKQKVKVAKPPHALSPEEKHELEMEEQEAEDDPAQTDVLDEEELHPSTKRPSDREANNAAQAFHDTEDDDVDSEKMKLAKSNKPASDKEANEAPKAKKPLFGGKNQPKK